MAEGKSGVQIRLGAPYAPEGSKCFYCGATAIRTAHMEGSIVKADGRRIGFKESGTAIHMCHEHSVFDR